MIEPPLDGDVVTAAVALASTLPLMVTAPDVAIAMLPPSVIPLASILPELTTTTACPVTTTEPPEPIPGTADGDGDGTGVLFETILFAFLAVEMVNGCVD